MGLLIESTIKEAVEKLTDQNRIIHNFFEKDSQRHEEMMEALRTMLDLIRLSKSTQN